MLSVDSLGEEPIALDRVGGEDVCDGGSGGETDDTRDDGVGVGGGLTITDVWLAP